MSSMLEKFLEKTFNFLPKVKEPDHWERTTCPSPPYTRHTRMQSAFVDSVFGFPSTGGMLQLDCSNTELDFLGLPTLLPQDIARSLDRIEEDTFCDKMRLLDATLWPSMGHWVESSIGNRKRKGDEGKEVRIGWPIDGKGVWVVSWEWKDERELMMGRELVKRARSMNERCEVIERLGGRFYENPKNCPEFAAVFAGWKSLQVSM
ncbi:hypothetical protein DL98DRAFT_655034 [Cadophora sp. DSE1049]|nr:hypothetical protein DL98DRAFT_655034 [Cadophora sp. DSE1049]